MKSKNLPKFLKPYFWSVNFSDLSFSNDKDYIIHQVLSFGDLKAIKWLFRAYSKATIKKSFLNRPTKIYRPQTFNFVKNFLLDLNKNININKYVINTPRGIR